MAKNSKRNDVGYLRSIMHRQAREVDDLTTEIKRKDKRIEHLEMKLKRASLLIAELVRKGT